MTDEPSTYKAAGVDIEAGDEAVYRLKDYAKSTYTPNVLADIGSFGGMFRFDGCGMEEPVLVSSIDSVGTKVKVAAMVGGTTPSESIWSTTVSTISSYRARVPCFSSTTSRQASFVRKWLRK